MTTVEKIQFEADFHNAVYTTAECPKMFAMMVDEPLSPSYLNSLINPEEFIPIPGFTIYCPEIGLSYIFYYVGQDFFWLNQPITKVTEII